MFKRQSVLERGMAMFGRESSSTKEMRKDTRFARRLGWVSLGVAASELFATRQVEDLLGIDDHPQTRGILRMLGVRELMHGIGILTERRPNHQLRTGVWSRVLGDMLDNVLLAVASMKTRKPGSFAAVAATVGAIGFADMKCAVRLQRHKHAYA